MKDSLIVIHHIVLFLTLTITVRVLLIPLKQLLLQNPRVRQYMGEQELDDLLNPAKYTGLSAQFVDRVTGQRKQASAT